MPWRAFWASEGDLRAEVLILCLIVGAFTYGFRLVPTRLDLSKLNPVGPLSRFLSSTGPAAIATLFVASILPSVQGAWQAQLPLGAGVLSVLIGYGSTRSVVVATLLGSFAYGLVFALI